MTSLHFGESVTKNCIFCEIVRGERAAEIVHQDDTVTAFKDIRPHAPVHILLVPKRHIRSINDLIDEDRSVVSNLIFKAREIAAKVGIAKSGYKLAFNVERGGGQYIFHLHLHLLGGW